jgi:hypothetical protein
LTIAEAQGYFGTPDKSRWVETPKNAMPAGIYRLDMRGPAGGVVSMSAIFPTDTSIYNYQPTCPGMQQTGTCAAIYSTAVQDYTHGVLWIGVNPDNTDADIRTPGLVAADIDVAPRGLKVYRLN